MNANQYSSRAIWILLTASLVTFAGCDGSGTGNPGNSGSEGMQDQTESSPLSVIMVTDKGRFEIELHPDETPRSVANFCNLVTQGFYHNKDFTAANTVARSLGETPRLPKYQIPQEFSAELLFDKPGVVAWTTLPRRTADDDYFPHPTRFFMTVAPQENWNFQFVPFGTVISGLDTVQNIMVGDWIKSARVKGDPTWLFERYAEDIAKWNSELERNGLVGQKASGDLKMPVSSN